MRPRDVGFSLERASLRNECATYLPVPPTRQGLTQGQWPEGRLKWGLGESKVGYEPRLEPCWSMLLIDPRSAMWAWWAKLVPRSNAAHPPEGDPTETGRLTASSLPWVPFQSLATRWVRSICHTRHQRTSMAQGRF